MLFALLLAPAALASAPAPVPCSNYNGYAKWQQLVDKASDCKVDDPSATGDDNAYGYFDADEQNGETTMILSIHPVVKYEDHDGKTHAGTVGAAPKYVDSDKRWELDCPQRLAAWDAADPPLTAPQKTLRIRVDRPVDIPAPGGAESINYFQGEFLNMYKKGQWDVASSEKEPYTHNNFGSAVPLDQFRGTLVDDCLGKESTCLGESRHCVGQGEGCESDQDLSKDTSKTWTKYFNVFMAVPDEGDFEFRYGNPNLILGRTTADADCLRVDKDGKKDGQSVSGCGTWAAVSFSKSSLRVGTPWKTCGAADALSSRGRSFGAIVPAYLGHPNLEKTAFDELTDTLVEHATVETLVVLDIFSPKAGNLEIDPDKCADGTAKPTEGDCPDGQGLKVIEKNVKKWTFSGKGSAAYSGNDAPDCVETATATAPRTCYDKCYEAGTPCPDNHSVCKAKHCSIDRFGAIIHKLTKSEDDKGVEVNTNVKVLGFVETMTPDGIPRAEADILGDAEMYFKFGATKVDGIFFNRVDSDQADSKTRVKKVAHALESHKLEYMVFATGEALLDDTLTKDDTKDGNTVGRAADIVVTLSADKEEKKDWSPFAYYPDSKPKQWGALLTNVNKGLNEETPPKIVFGDEDVYAKLLFDRGYGWVGLHEAAGKDAYGKVSKRLKEALDEIAAQGKEAATGRRLQGRKLAEAPASSYTWSCDAAQFYCAPVCMRTTGVVTTIVPDSKCEGVKQSCSCSCLFDAHWDCVDGAVVCKATHTTRLVPEIVGDLVCSTRGTEKPETCIRQLTARGTYPEEQCMTQFEEAKTARLAANVAREEAAAAREAARVAAEAKAATTAAPTEKAPDLADVVDVQSSALPAALLAFAGLFA